MHFYAYGYLEKALTLTSNYKLVAYIEALLELKKSIHEGSLSSERILSSSSSRLICRLSISHPRKLAIYLIDNLALDQIQGIIETIYYRLVDKS